MERIAIISDIHGNIPALEAVLKDIKQRGIKRIICLGDIVGKGPNSAKAVDLIQSHCEDVVKGNWDYFITEKTSKTLEWHQKQLGEERLAYLKNLPIYLEFYMSGQLVRLCHASPHDLFHRTYLWSPISERLKLFAPTKTLDCEADIIGYGDIHGAHLASLNQKTIFNVGSVGNPLDMTLSSYVIFEGEEGTKDKRSSLNIAIVRVPYDIDRAVSEAMATDMPEKEAYIKELRTAIYRGR